MSKAFWRVSFFWTVGLFLILCLQRQGLCTSVAVRVEKVTAMGRERWEGNQTQPAESSRHKDADSRGGGGWQWKAELGRQNTAGLDVAVCGRRG